VLPPPLSAAPLELMSNAAKLKKKAAEFEQKKQFDKALQLYIQILDTGADDGDEGDVALYNRVGDLLMRQGTVGDAMTYYEKAVDLYAESGFFNNAIALCNKILRQSPGRNSIYYKLGKISAKKGFISDAKQNFLEYASRMQTGGQLDEAFRALKEFADLCPDQDDIRLMLADQLSKKDRKGEALEQLQVLYQKFEQEGRGADMRATVDRMRAIDPAAEPKSGSGPRNPKSTDLVFLDLSDGGAAAGRAAPPAPVAPAAQPVAPPAAKPRPVAPPPGAGLRGAPPARGLGGRPAARVPTVDLPLIEVDLPPLDAAYQIEDPRAPAPQVAGLVPPEVSIPRDTLDTPIVAGLEGSSHRAEPASERVPELPGLQTLSGEQFASLTLATPFHVPVIEPPAHDLALPGELPPLGGALLSAVNFTGEMELIMPDGADEALPGRPAKPVPGRGRGDSAASHTHRDDREPDIALPMLDVDLPELDQPRARGSRQISGPLGLVSGPELLDEIPLGDESLDQDQTDTAEASDSGRGISASDGMPDLDRPLSASGETEALDADDTPPAWAAPDPIDSEVDEAIEFMAGDSAARREVWPELRAADADEGEDADEAEEADESDAASDADDAALESVAPIDDAESYAGANGSAPEPGGAGVTADAIVDDAALGPVGRTSGGAPRRRSSSELARSVDTLLARAEASPQDWALRRQLAEALLDDGDREAGLRELEASMIGLERAQDLEGARSMADEIIRLNPNSVRHHQKRVEYAFRTNDRARLPEAYLELADALFRSGQADKARAVYQRVLELAPDDARAQAALSAFGDPVDAAGAGADASPGATPPAGVTREVTPPAAPAVRPSVPNVRHRPSGPKPGVPSATPKEPGQFVNLGDWLRDDEAPKSTRMVIDDEKTGDPEADFADMLRQFKHGIAQNVAEEDHESHYDLGVAYKEMGLLDEAISEFQKALRGPGHRVRTYEALGQCFIEKQQFQVAATILSRALDEPGVTDDQLVGVLYLLGYASEALMRWEAAIGYYQRVFAVDIQFRDAGQRLTRLERAPR
jgi:tetratricopeptide (TPR) repeat protein